MPVFFDPDFDARELCLYVNGGEDHERILMKKTKDKLGMNGFVKENQRRENSSALPVVLFTKRHFHCVTRANVLKSFWKTLL